VDHLQYLSAILTIAMLCIQGATALLVALEDHHSESQLVDHLTNDPLNSTTVSELKKLDRAQLNNMTVSELEELNQNELNLEKNQDLHLYQ
jgi:hypothetical protein